MYPHCSFYFYLNHVITEICNDQWKALLTVFVNGLIPFSAWRWYVCNMLHFLIDFSETINITLSSTGCPPETSTPPTPFPGNRSDQSSNKSRAWEQTERYGSVTTKTQKHDQLYDNTQNTRFNLGWFCWRWEKYFQKWMTYYFFHMQRATIV